METKTADWRTGENDLGEWLAAFARDGWHVIGDPVEVFVDGVQHLRYSLAR